MDDLESAFNRLIVLGLRVELPDRVVRGDVDLARTDGGKDIALALCTEWVVISPYFEVLSTYHLGTKVLDDDVLLSGVVVPPDVAPLEVELVRLVLELLSDRA